jgi:hypothetical protein
MITKPEIPADLGDSVAILRGLVAVLCWKAGRTSAEDFFARSAVRAGTTE